MLSAVRVDPIRLGPDFRPDHDLRVYSDYGLSSLLDMISELVDFAEPATLQLETGRYVLWMLPHTDG
jgi:hypothetical protein